MVAALSFSGTSTPAAPPVKLQEFARMRKTSAKASVTSAKYDPLETGTEAEEADEESNQPAKRNPDRQGEPWTQAEAHLQQRHGVAAGPEKNAAWPKENWPP